MSVDVFVADEQSGEAVDTLRWVRLAEAVLEDEGVRGDAELSVLFVDEGAIADLNKRFLGKDGPTDVLSFPIDEEPAESGRSPDSGGSGPGYTGEPPEAPTLLGDIVICPTVARRNAPEHAGTYEDELALLVVHGILHLLGLDHEEDADAEVMEAKERALLAKHHRPVPALDPVPEGPDGAGPSDSGEPSGAGGPGASGHPAPPVAEARPVLVDDPHSSTAPGPAGPESSNGARRDDGPVPFAGEPPDPS